MIDFDFLSELPYDCLEETLDRLVRDPKLVGLSRVLVLSKEMRAQAIRYLQRRRWDDILLDRGKVCLEGLAVLGGVPELRERAVRYAKGKTRFVFRGTMFFQLNDSRCSESLQLIVAGDRRAATDILWSRSYCGFRGSYPPRELGPELGEDARAHAKRAIRFLMKLKDIAWLNYRLKDF